MKTIKKYKLQNTVKAKYVFEPISKNSNYLHEQVYYEPIFVVIFGKVIAATFRKQKRD